MPAETPSSPAAAWSHVRFSFFGVALLGKSGQNSIRSSSGTPPPQHPNTDPSLGPSAGNPLGPRPLTHFKSHSKPSYLLNMMCVVLQHVTWDLAFLRLRCAHYTSRWASPAAEARRARAYKYSLHKKACTKHRLCSTSCEIQLCLRLQHHGLSSIHTEASERQLFFFGHGALDQRSDKRRMMKGQEAKHWQRGVSEDPAP